MIDMSVEDIFPLSEVPKRVPGRNGRRLNTCTAYRWAQRGVRGVKLEVLALGGCKYTSLAALQRFAERLSGGGVPRLRTSRQRERAHARAARELEAEGVL